MSITPIDKKGLQLSLDTEYERLLIERGGVDFWFIPNQRLLRTKLSPFLPRMEYDAVGNKVYASIVKEGKELLSTSEPATPSLSNVPESELRKLRDTLAALKEEVDDVNTAEATKQLIKSFVLPNPDKAPELYRLYGKGKNKRLAIIWGLGKNVKTADGVVSSTSAATNVKLEEMPDVLPQPKAPSSSLKWWPWVLLLLAAGGLTYCLMSDSDKEDATQTAAATEQGGTSEPQPAATPEQGGTSEPKPAATPEQSGTPEQTSTPEQSGTPEPKPVATPEQDGTSEPKPAATPEQDGTSEPKPAATPEQDGTSEPKPAATPEQDGTSEPKPEVEGEPVKNSDAYTITPDPYTIEIVNSEDEDQGNVKLTFCINPTNAADEQIKRVNIGGVEKDGFGELSVTIPADCVKIPLEVETTAGVYKKDINIKKN